MKNKNVSKNNTKRDNSNKTSEKNKELKESYNTIVDNLINKNSKKDKDKDTRESYNAIVDNLIDKSSKKSKKDVENNKNLKDDKFDKVIDDADEYSVKNDEISINVSDDSMPNETMPVKTTLADSKNVSKKYMGYNERLVIMISGIFLFAMLSLILLLSSLKLNTKKNIVYNQSSNVDYTVSLKPNNYYSTPTLSKGMQYIASLIDNVNISFNYKFNSSEKATFKYYYYANANVKIYTSDNKVIYSKTNTLIPRKPKTAENATDFNVAENIKINYDQYNNIIKNFKSSYGISANSSLEVVLYVGVEDEKGNVIKSSEADAMKVIIPLTEQMINISMDYKEVNNSNNADVYKEIVIANKFLFVVSIIFGVAMLAMIVLFVLFMRKTSKKKTPYDIKLNRILKDYDKLIVTSKKGIYQSEKIVEVGTFEELLDARDNLEKPIIFTEIHKGQKAMFIVNGDNETYKYVLKLADLEKESGKKSIFGK